ncbi:hypothetical protein CAPTEDRAFT_152907 [Capitella teleta]|uniref:G-protein coupled receptors family 1 profile domain-containing protein n=1 Tax=Capitella teleta TaxID=283909 RepID=R7TR36_CAPTE|nr:hypothetical protein CAPTEDRAFT_152907 [Capitella teleta]|eukprot:ELT93500.1 hypothetical protein CAPTEDRAFT_152907 [Capitella teleta]
MDNTTVAGAEAESRGSTPVGTPAIAFISVLFCIIGLIGIIGNTLVILIVLTDRKMRRSVTNLFITNVALSDLLIMLCGIPETAQFILNRGWILGEATCKMERYVLVVSLYSSVVTLVGVCIERYIAIVYPIKARILCSRRRMLMCIALTWPSVLILGLPVVLYNQLIRPSPDAPFAFCKLQFPHNQMKFMMAFKYFEFVLFYSIPMVVQIVCYVIIGRRLFAGSAELHRTQTVTTANGVQREKTSEAMKARKGVIKMLIASVIIYFLSYSPHQILLFYNTFSRAPFHQTWVFLVFVTAMGYINSAANPILYCIFSLKFRSKFKVIFTCKCFEDTTNNNQRFLGMTNTTQVVVSPLLRDNTKDARLHRSNCKRPLTFV